MHSDANRTALQKARDAAKAKSAALTERVRQLSVLYQGERNSTKRIAKELGITDRTVREKRKQAGVSLKPGEPGVPNDEVLPEIGDHTPIYERGWTILKLFDTLMTFFQTADTPDKEATDEEDPSAADSDLVDAALPTDPRSTWTAWRVFLAAAFGVPQADLAIDQHEGTPLPAYPGVTQATPRGAAAPPAGATPQEIFELCTKRITWPEKQARIVSLIVGRRGGKSYITAIIGIYLACCRKYNLNLGTKGMVMILARDKEQAGVIRGYVLAFLRAVPMLRVMLVGEPTQKLIELSNGITIEIRAVGEAGTRGYTVVGALMDEIAFWPTDPDSAKQDKKVLRALRPAMLGIKNAMLVMLSSPYAAKGELHEMHRKHYAKDESKRVLVWQADTLSMRPSDDDDLHDEIKTEYEEDPESAKAEYGAFFRSDLESIFTRESVAGVSVTGRLEAGYRREYKYRAFVDPSGGSSDSYVLAIAHDEVRGNDVVPVLDKVKEWQPKFDPEAVSIEIVGILKEFHIGSVTGDAYGGEWPRDPLKKRKIKYELCEMNRSELYLAFVPLVNAKQCELLDVEGTNVGRRLSNQLANLERRVGRSGKDSVDHPAGQHDDVANAVAGVMVTKGSGKKDRATW